LRHRARGVRRDKAFIALCHRARIHYGDDLEIKTCSGITTSHSGICRISSGGPPSSRRKPNVKGVSCPLHAQNVRSDRYSRASVTVRRRNSCNSRISNVSECSCSAGSHNSRAGVRSPSSRFGSGRCSEDTLPFLW